MSGEVPEIIKKGELVSYKGENVKVLDYYFSCPCVVGITDHHPDADWPVIILEGIGAIPFSSEDFTKAKVVQSKYIPSDPDCQTC